jgi:hypothetical protein
MYERGRDVVNNPGRIAYHEKQTPMRPEGIGFYLPAR